MYLDFSFKGYKLWINLIVLYFYVIIIAFFIELFFPLILLCICICVTPTWAQWIHYENMNKLYEYEKCIWNIYTYLQTYTYIWTFYSVTYSLINQDFTLLSSTALWSTVIWPTKPHFVVLFKFFSLLVSCLTMYFLNLCWHL